MTTISVRDVEHVFEALRKGLVPERAIETFAVGIEKHRGELHRQLDLVADYPLVCDMAAILIMGGVFQECFSEVWGVL